MEQASPLPPESVQRDPRQYIKLVVYVLLLVNFGNYIAEDMMIGDVNEKEDETRQVEQEEEEEDEERASRVSD